MNIRKKIEQAHLYLTQNLCGYEVIPANWGWYIHKEGTYCGLLHYQQTRGWQGEALTYLPTEVREQLKKLV